MPKLKPSPKVVLRLNQQPIPLKSPEEEAVIRQIEKQFSTINLNTRNNKQPLMNSNTVIPAASGENVPRTEVMPAGQSPNTRSRFLASPTSMVMNKLPLAVVAYCDQSNQQVQYQQTVAQQTQQNQNRNNLSATLTETQLEQTTLQTQATLQMQPNRGN